MLRISCILLVLVTAFSCGKKSDNTDQSYWFSEELQREILENPAVPAIAHSFDASIKFVNFTAADQQKVENAVDLLKQVIASPEFKLEVLDHTYNGSKTYVDNNGLSNSQIYQVLLEGAEKLRPIKNHAIDVELELYFQDNNVIGYTYPSSMRIWMNTKYFNNYLPTQVAGNLAHEWLHKLGFTHATSWSIARDHSVPYALGRMIVRHSRKFYSP